MNHADVSQPSLHTPDSSSDNRAKPNLVEIVADLERTRRMLNLANAEIERRNRNMIALTTFAYRANRIDNLEGLLRLTVMQALEVTRATIGAVVLVDGETGDLSLGYHEGLNEHLKTILTGQNVGDGAIALMPHLVAGTGALLERRASDDPAEQQLLEMSNLNSLASFPLIVSGHLVGAMLMGLQSDRGFRSSELSFLMALSQTTAISIEGLRLRDRVWRIAESLLKENVPLLQLPPTPETTRSSTPKDEELHQQSIDLQILMALSEMVNRSLNLDEILQTAVDQTKAILNTDAAWIYMVDEQQMLKIKAQVGLSKSYVHGMRRLTNEDDIEVEVVRNNKPSFVASITNRPHKIWVDKEGLRALATVPITRRYLDETETTPHWHVMGVLGTGIRNQSYEWTVHEMDLLTAIANQVGIAIEKAQSYEDVRFNETSLKGSNAILREINEMLIQKNAAFEKYVHQTLKPALNKATHALNHMEPTRLDIADKKQLLTLQQLIADIKSATDIVLNS